MLGYLEERLMVGSTSLLGAIHLTTWVMTLLSLLFSLWPDRREIEPECNVLSEGKAGESKNEPS